MKKINNFTNLYSVMKTERFKLIPIGKTEDNFCINNLLAEDEHRSKSYEYVKQYLDRYYKDYIDKILPMVKLDGLNEYAELYYKLNKTESEKKEMQKVEDKLRKQIADALTSNKKYNTLFKKDVIKDLPDFLTDAEEIERVKEFFEFSTYFSGFFNNRKNMFTAEEKSTGIAYRCINENLPRFLDNVKSFGKVKTVAPEIVESINTEFEDLFSIKAEDLFCADGFTYALCQADIDRYNQVIGGYSNSDKSKIQGLNEKINLHNQQTKEKDKRLPKLKPLYKQILSEKSTVSFIPEKFESDNAVIEAIHNYFDSFSICDNVLKTKELFCTLCKYDLSKIFVKNDLSLTEVSKCTFGRWDAVRCSWEKEYDELKGYKDTEKYSEARKKAYKSTASFSIESIDRLGNKSADEEYEDGSVCEWAKNQITELANKVIENYNKEKEFLSSEYKEEKKLCTNSDKIGEIKELLDSVKSVEAFVKLFMGTGKEEIKDEMFYGELFPYFEAISEIDRLYDKVRNYVTQKPYSTDKIKLNFGNPQFLGGWDRNKEADYSAVLLRKDGLYYIAIMDNKNRNIFKQPPEAADGELFFDKIVYRQIPNSAKYFSSKQILPQNPPDKIKDILFKKKADNKSLTSSETEEFINYIKYDFLENYPLLRDENGEKYFDFSVRPSNEYQNLQEFFTDLDNQAYILKYRRVPKSYIDEKINCGELYLFQIYNKDFSSFSHGNPNLHTMYFKALFDEKNLENPVFKLNGDAEMFYRKSSIKYNDEIMEKGHHYNELKDKFPYPIIKDKRYTQNQFMLHIPITLNFNSEGIERINERVRISLKSCDDNYVIGIDRGERNLIYICVINGQGKIVEQYSLNDIVNEYNGNTYCTDYHALLDAKEKERLDARKNWSAVENIKELKEGYISQVIHKICQLVEKYDAVIAMEDLNFGFKNSRSKVEKSVYQKFEKMLIDKLNFYVNKKTDVSLPGGLYNAYQLTEKFESFKKMGKQNGFIFYIPAWLTSKIDPTTGFVDMLYPSYESVEASKKFFEKFKHISYNSDRDYFEFEFDYSDFGAGNTDYIKHWTLCTFGDRIETFRNTQKNGEWDNRTVNLTDEFKALFEKYAIGVSDEMRDEIISHNEKEFYAKLTKLLKLTLQMRNSITGTDVDYLISPIKNRDGVFYDSRNYSGENAPLPVDADANGAFHIAKKALWAIEQIKSADDVKSAKISISKPEWLEFVQKQ